MAQFGLKQLDSVLTGSLQVSGSSGLTGSLSVDTNIVAGNRVTSDYGTINYSMVVNEAGHGGGDFRVEGTTDPYLIFADAGTDKLAIGTSVVSPSLLTVDGDITATHVTASGNISGSLVSTGSFGRVEAGVIEANTYIVSSSVTNISIATLSGSTEFGDTADDTHTFTGNITASGNINTTSGRVYEQGTSVIDHATAMAIVFGG